MSTDNEELRLSKEQAKENVLTRGEAEAFLNKQKMAFQYLIKEKKINVLKEVGREGSSRKTQLFWKPDLIRYKEALEIVKKKS